MKEIVKNGKKYFMCEECGMYYLERELAEKCEAFCKKFKGCNLEITKHAVQLD